jgi:dolichyl-phosphate beta-glucosyltransferase
MQISIIIPCYNEDRRIGPSLAKLGRYCEETFDSCEILVVDDGSTDDTWEIIRKMDSRVKAIRLPWNSGKGAAVKAGMLEAGGQYRFFTDADLPYDLPAFSSAVDRFHASGCDLVIGARDLPGSLDTAGTNLSRKPASRIFSGVADLLFGIDIHDTQCGFKGFTGPAAVDLFSRCSTRGYAFDVEILTLARCRGFRVCRVPVNLVENDHSAIFLPRDGLAMLWQLMLIYLRTRRLPKAGR